MRQSLWKSISLSAKKRSRFYFDLLLGTGIGTVCLCFVLWDLDWKRVADVFRRINPAYFILAVFLTMLSDFLRAYRWKIILDPVRPVGIVRLFRAEVLGLIANCILPIKVNELLKVYIVCRNEGLHPASVLSTVTIERMYDSIIVLVLFGVGLKSLTSFPVWLQQLGFFLIGMALTATLLVLAFYRYPRRMQTATRWIARSFSQHWRERLDGFIEKFSSGMVSVGSPSNIATTAAVGLVLWLLLVISYYCSLLALDVRLPLLSVFVLLAAIVLGFSLPSLPCAVGPYQAAVILCLTYFGADKETGLAVAIIIFLSDLISLVPFGLFFALRGQTPPDAR